MTRHKSKRKRSVAGQAGRRGTQGKRGERTRGGGRAKSESEGLGDRGDACAARSRKTERAAALNEEVKTNRADRTKSSGEVLPEVLHTSQFTHVTNGKGGQRGERARTSRERRDREEVNWKGVEQGERGIPLWWERLALATQDEKNRHSVH